MSMFHKKLHYRPHIMHEIPLSHSRSRVVHLLHDPRFWAIFAIAAITILIVAMIIFTGGTSPEQQTNPVIPGPYIY